MPAKMRVCYTTRRGKVYGCSIAQHRLLHGRKLDHTHMKGDLRIRHRWDFIGRFKRATWRE